MATWILVCDASRAKLFSVERRGDSWSLVQEFEHPEGRMSSREIQPSSPPGRMQESRAVGARRSSMEPPTSPKDAEADRFARELAAQLDEATTAGKLDALVLVAPPHFLGTLQAVLSKQTAKHVQTKVDKDLVMLKDAEIRERLLDVVFGAEEG